MSSKAGKFKRVNPYVVHRRRDRFVSGDKSWYNNTKMNNPIGLDFLPVILAHVNRGTIWWVFVFVCVLFAVFSSVLIFHWERYGRNNPKVILAEIVYLVVSVEIVSLAYSSIIAFINHA